MATENNRTPDECLYCGQDDPGVNYTWHQPYSSEPGAWVCPDCMEERPWK